jgi:glutathione S-transferase
MKLHDLERSPNCRKVRIIARELGLPLELVPMDSPRLPEPAYIAKNPAGKAPTFVDDDGFTLWESGAILAYLAHKQPDRGLLPADPRGHADVMRWMFFLGTHLQPWLSLLDHERLLKTRKGETPDPQVILLAEGELGRFVPIVDSHLQGRTYLSGQYSIADIAVGCTLEGCESRGFSLRAFAQIQSWLARLRQRPAWAD